MPRTAPPRQTHLIILSTPPPPGKKFLDPRMHVIVCFSYQVENNVCFGAVGHGYFLEEGGEVDTTFAGNLGAGNTRTNKLTKTDGYVCDKYKLILSPLGFDPRSFVQIFLPIEPAKGFTH